MKKQFLLAALACLVIVTTAWGQEEDMEDKYLNAEQYLYEIRDTWADNPIQVLDTFPKAKVRNFAKAFCAMYPKYRPNKAMTDYLRKPGTYTWEEKGYMTEDDPRNGYIMCDMGGQFSYHTAVCYWRRPQGHLLVGVHAMIGNEGERCDAVLLFYDYDPQTGVMTPDTVVYQTVMDIMGKHEGSMYIKLPQEGKDIQVSAVRWTPTDDFVYDDFELKWNGNSFSEK